MSFLAVRCQFLLVVRRTVLFTCSTGKEVVIYQDNYSEMLVVFLPFRFLYSESVCVFVASSSGRE